MRLQASFTIEASVVMAVILFTIASILRVAIQKHGMVIVAYETHALATMLAHDEEDFGKDSDDYITASKREISYVEVLADGKMAYDTDSSAIKASFDNTENSVDIEVKVFNPELYMRTTTVMEGLYERGKDALSEGTE